jgi:hypothetical protein
MRKGGVSEFLSAREIVTGRKLRLPPHEIGQFVHASVGETNNLTDVYRTFESLYIGRNDNGSGHYVFDIRTGCMKSAERVTPLPMPQRVTDRVNAMGLHDKQPEDIIIGDRNDQQTVNDFNIGLEENEEENDDDATDESFDPIKILNKQEIMMSVITLKKRPNMTTSLTNMMTMSRRWKVKKQECRTATTMTTTAMIPCLKI